MSEIVVRSEHVHGGNSDSKVDNAVRSVRARSARISNFHISFSTHYVMQIEEYALVSLSYRKLTRRFALEHRTLDYVPGVQLETR